MHLNLFLWKPNLPRWYRFCWTFHSNLWGSHNYILTISNYFTQWVEANPIPLTLTLRHLCLYAYNTSWHESTNFTPFGLMFGRKAVLPVEIDMKKEWIEPLSIELSSSALETITNRRQQLLGEAKENILKAQKQTVTKEKLLHQHMQLGKKYWRKIFTKKNELAAKWMPNTWVHSLLQRGLERDSISFN